MNRLTKFLGSLRLLTFYMDKPKPKRLVSRVDGVRTVVTLTINHVVERMRATYKL